jgi:hypothetical protein
MPPPLYPPCISPLRHQGNKCRRPRPPPCPQHWQQGLRSQTVGRWQLLHLLCILRLLPTPPPPLSACVVANPPPSLIVARPCPTPCTASNQTAAINRPSHAHHCYGIPPDCDHVSHCRFCRHSVDIGDNARYHPPLSRALVAPPLWPHPVPSPYLSASKHPRQFPATTRHRRLHFGG